MTALEICAGEKLFNIMVGEGNAEVALLLVGYADEVKNAMEFMFGETSVCKTNAAAEKVAFDRRVKTRSVTLEGDLFQSGGLVTGSSVRCVGDQLRQLHALGEAYSELSLHEKRLSEIEAKLSEIVKRIKQELEEAKSALTEKHAFYEESITKVANLVISVQDHANNEDGSLKTRAEKIEAVKKKMQSAKKNLKNEISTLTSEVDLLKIKVTSLKYEHSQAQSEFNTANTKLVECDSQISCIRKEQEKSKDRIREKVFEQKRLESEVKF
ncbi:structural maintenance of chromosomes protein 2 [Tanacetum coccineum]